MTVDFDALHGYFQIKQLYVISQIKHRGGLLNSHSVNDHNTFQSSFKSYLWPVKEQERHVQQIKRTLAQKLSVTFCLLLYLFYQHLLRSLFPIFGRFPPGLP
jgi:hypothetical protein